MKCEKIEKIGLNTIGTLREEMGAGFDVFCRHQVKVEKKGQVSETHYLLRTRGTNRIESKARLSFDPIKRVNRLDEMEDITEKGWVGIIEKLGIDV